MKKTFIATALFAAFGIAQAAPIIGDSTSWTIVQPGESIVNAGPHTSGKPGIGLDGSYTDTIDFAGINAFTYKATITPATGVSFTRHQLLGYTHSSAGGTITKHINWVKVNNDVYFGLASIPGTPNSQHAAFYVGERAGYAMPTTTTNYAAAGLLALPGTLASSPIILTGVLQYDVGAATLNTTTPLTDGAYTLAISSNVNAGAGTFGGASGGTSTLSGSASGTGSVSGHFYGSGATSAVAGMAASTSGANYVASFGGIKN